MYSRSQLRRGLELLRERPAYAGRECNRLYYRRLYRRPFNTDGVDVMDEAWDNLLILDACRYDMFAAQASLPGSLERRISRGSHTREFLAGNFGGRNLFDTVYVTASPQLHRWSEEIDARFHHVIDVWRADGWDDDHGTVLPETVNEYARAAHERFPDKRLIVHYLQPHYPFIDAESTLNARTFGADGGGGADVWGELMRGTLDVSAGDVWGAYRRNLDRVLPAVAALLEELPGLTVVTSDHGNMVGERARPVPIREWGHPPGIHTPELVEVPWLVYDEGRRKQVVWEEPDHEVRVESTGDDETAEPAGTVQDRLEQLGYVE